MGDIEAKNRRTFLSNMARWATAGAALFTVPACGIEEILTEEEDLLMHGPIKVAERWLKLPLEVEALPLLAPYEDGSIFLRSWAFGHIVRGPKDQLAIVIVDLETGGHAEIELFKPEPDIAPVAETAHYGLIINNGGLGDVSTPRHIRRLARKVSRIISSNEENVTLSWRVPTLSEKMPKPGVENLEPADQPIFDEPHSHVVSAPLGG
ncbi:MAG: hypothetical protein CMH54_10945 [Myxococcales bacterium]|nr:hypothetical protein [Myxococcales bacterium]